MTITEILAQAGIILLYGVLTWVVLFIGTLFMMFLTEGHYNSRFKKVTIPRHMSKESQWELIKRSLFPPYAWVLMIRYWTAVANTFRA